MELEKFLFTLLGILTILWIFKRIAKFILWKIIPFAGSTTLTAIAVDKFLEGKVDNKLKPILTFLLSLLSGILFQSLINKLNTKKKEKSLEKQKIAQEKKKQKEEIEKRRSCEHSFKDRELVLKYYIYQYRYNNYSDDDHFVTVYNCYKCTCGKILHEKLYSQNFNHGLRSDLDGHIEELIKEGYIEYGKAVRDIRFTNLFSRNITP